MPLGPSIQHLWAPHDSVVGFRVMVSPFCLAARLRGVNVVDLDGDAHPSDLVDHRLPALI